MNAKQEFLRAVANQKVECAVIRDANEERTIAELKLNYSLDELDEFLDKLDFEYEPEMYSDALTIEGTIWCQGGVWLTREEANERCYVSEHWHIRKMPLIPEYLF